MFKPKKCKTYAALVPTWVHVHEKAVVLVLVARMLVFENTIDEALGHYQQASMQVFNGCIN